MVQKTIKETKTIMIKIGYEVTDDGILCENGDTVQYIWGSKIAITDLSRRLLKKNDKWVIPFKILKERFP